MNLVIVGDNKYKLGVPSEVVLFEKKPRIINIIDSALELDRFDKIFVFTNSTKKNILESYLTIYDKEKVFLIETNVNSSGEIVYKYLKTFCEDKEAIFVGGDFEVTSKELYRLSKFKLNRYNLAFPVLKKDSQMQFVLNKDEECSCIKKHESPQRFFTNDFFFKCNKNILFYLESIRKVIFKDGEWLIPFTFYDVVHTMWADKRNYVITYQEKSRIL